MLYFYPLLLAYPMKMSRVTRAHSTASITRYICACVLSSDFILIKPTDLHVKCSHQSSSSYTDRLSMCGRSTFNYWLLIWTTSSSHIQQLSPKMVSDINLHGVLLWASMGFLMPLGVITVRMSHREEGGRRKALVYLHVVLQVNSFIAFANGAWFRFFRNESGKKR